MKLETKAAKTYLDGRREHRPLSDALLQCTIFQARDAEQLRELFGGASDRVYTRFGHPNTTAAARRVAELEGAEAALAFGSGMGAISTALLAALPRGRHVVSQGDVFAQTRTFLERICKLLGMRIDFVDATRVDSVAAALRPETALVYVETPSNPLLKVCDIAAIAELCNRPGIPLFVDSTFATPFAQTPLALGATLVLHSGTKFLGGHSDVMCGFAAGERRLVERIREMQVLLGNVLDPHAAWLVTRGMKTLAVRVQRQSENALTIARFLATHTPSPVAAVHYPLLEGTPYHDVARRQMRWGGGVVSFEVKAGLRGARAFLDALELIPVATSLGGVESVIEIPGDLDFSAAEIGTASASVAPGLIRLSVGIEDVQDLIADLDRALRAAAPSGAA